MYEYFIINETQGDVMGYENAEEKARARVEKEARSAGNDRLAVVKRIATYEAMRVWK